MEKRGEGRRKKEGGKMAPREKGLKHGSPNTVCSFRIGGPCNLFAIFSQIQVTAGQPSALCCQQVFRFRGEGANIRDSLILFENLNDRKSFQRNEKDEFLTNSILERGEKRTVKFLEIEASISLQKTVQLEQYLPISISFVLSLEISHKNDNKKGAREFQSGPNPSNPDVDIVLRLVVRRFETSILTTQIVTTFR